MPAPKQGEGAGWRAAGWRPESWGGVQGFGSQATWASLQVDATLQRLLERYRGPEPSDTVEMFEGEEFFAAFERGIDVDAGRTSLS